MSAPEDDHARIVAARDAIATVRETLGLNAVSDWLTRVVDAASSLVSPEGAIDRITAAIRLDPAILWPVR